MPPIRKPRKPRKLFSHHHAGAGTIWGLTEIHLPRLRTGCEVSDFSEVSDFGEKAHIRGLGRANTSCWTSSRRWSVPPGLEDAASSTAAQKPVRNKDNSEHSRSNPQNNPQKFMALRPPTLYVLAMPTVTTPSTSRTRAVDPQVRPLRWAGKAHTRQGRLFYALRSELVAHVGGSPSAAHRALIDRLAWMQVHLARMDQRILETGEMAEHTGKQYLAWSNSIARALAQLGLQAAPPSRPTLRDYLDGKGKP